MEQFRPPDQTSWRSCARAWPEHGVTTLAPAGQHTGENSPTYEAACQRSVTGHPRILGLWRRHIAHVGKCWARAIAEPGLPVERELWR